MVSWGKNPNNTIIIISHITKTRGLTLTSWGGGNALEYQEKALVWFV